MRREERRGLAKKVKAISHNEVYAFIEEACRYYGDELIQDAMKALHKEFGFGKDRQNRFLKALNETLEDRSKKKVQP